MSGTTHNRRVAVVTGASQGIGLEVCRRLAGQGLRVILTARTTQKAAKAAQGLRDDGLEIHPAALDVADETSIELFLRWLDEHEGRADVLINNAGIRPERYAPGEGGRSVFLANWAKMDEAMRTHVYGPLRLIQGVVPMMRREGYGRIVNVASTLGQLSAIGPGWPAYRISKAALNALTGVVAAELAEDPILVNSACPGWTRTALGGDSAPRSVEAGADTIVWLSLLDDDGPRGQFFQDRRPIAW